MKIFFSVIYCFFLICYCQAQTEPRTDDQLFSALSERVGIKIDSFDFFQNAPADKAWTAFAFLNSHLPKDGREFLQKSGKAIAKNPSVESYVRDAAYQLPNDFYNHNERINFIVPLGSVPASWSLKLLGHFVSDDIPMTIPKDKPDYDSSPNQIMAAGALSRMGFSDAPTKDWNPDLTLAQQQAWRDWWKANEGRVDQRIAEINPGYYHPTPTPIPATPTPTPLVIGEYASTPANTPKPTATPATTPAPVTNSNLSDSIIYIIGGILLAAVLAGLVWALRKRG